MDICKSSKPMGVCKERSFYACAFSAMANQTRILMHCRPQSWPTFGADSIIRCANLGLAGLFVFSEWGGGVHSVSVASTTDAHRERGMFDGEGGTYGSREEPVTLGPIPLPKAGLPTDLYEEPYKGKMESMPTPSKPGLNEVRRRPLWSCTVLSIRDRESCPNLCALAGWKGAKLGRYRVSLSRN